MRFFTRPDLSRDHTGRCGNCHEYIGDDSYCRFCGTKAGEGDFKPYSNVPTTVYGPPPVRRIHKCENCGYEWSTNLMLDKQKYCPKCGGKAPYNSSVPDR